MNNITQTYKGWIPTVSGRLSFDVVGTGSHPNPPDSMNLADKQMRYVLCRQERMLLDNAIPFREKSAFHFYKELGRFQFICIGEASNNISEDTAPLSGYLYIFENMVWNEIIHLEFKKYQELLHNYWTIGESQSLENYFKHHLNSITEYLKEFSYFHVPFIVQRNGVTIINIENIYAGNPEAPKIDEKELNYIEHSVCSQVFFFLKDILHNHQHHDPYTDTLSDVYLVRNKDDEFIWRCEAMRLLYRMVLTYKRNRKEQICNSALGIIAYAQSFRDISDKELGDNEKYTVSGRRLSPHVNDTLLIQSIHASQDSQRNYLQEKIKKSDKFTNIILGFLTIVLSLVGMLQITKISYEQEDVSVIFLFLSWAIITQPILCLVSLGIIGFFLAEKWGVYTFRRRTNVYRVIVTQDQRKAETALNLIGATILIFSFLLAAYFENIIVFIRNILNF